MVRLKKNVKQLLKKFNFKKKMYFKRNSYLVLYTQMLKRISKQQTSVKYDCHINLATATRQLKTSSSALRHL